MLLGIVNGVIVCRDTVGKYHSLYKLHHKPTMLFVMFDNCYLGICTTTRFTCVSIPVSITLHSSLKAQSNSPPSAQQAHAAAQLGSSPDHNLH
jgi:hypothetical protein